MKQSNLIDTKWLCVLVFPVCLAVMNRPLVKVTTKIGRVIGTEEFVSIEDGYVTPNSVRRLFYSFRGIPYAKPPVGELRWKVSPYMPDILIELLIERS